MKKFEIRQDCWILLQLGGRVFGVYLDQEAAFEEAKKNFLEIQKSVLIYNSEPSYCG